jgi:polyvinyl alcohol dehydrogenase (cytochrome)
MSATPLRAAGLPGLILSAALSLALTAPAQGQDPSGEQVFNDFCAACHVNLQAQDGKIPSVDSLRRLHPNAILRTLTDGAMRLQGDALQPAQRIAVAEYLGGGPVLEQALSFTQGMCESLPPLTSPAADATWSGWSKDAGNTRFTADTGGITRSNVAQLKLKWAFGIPDVTQARAQPAVWGDRIFVGSQAGVVFALDTNSGCTYWSFKTEGGVRSAISVAELDIDGAPRTVVFFNDLRAMAYAVDAETGELLWSKKVDEHPSAIATGALKYHDGKLYVPMSGLPEEALANHNNDYECCSFRGSVTALDARNGRELWKTYALPEPQLVRRLSDGRGLYGPAGAAIWNTPTIDTKRGLLYITTGNAYVEPPSSTSNAVLALDLESGQIRWVNQVLENDIWSGGCEPDLGGNTGNEGCFQPVGPDFDFSASVVLTTMANGKDILVATQKSGLGFAFDPDDGGRTLWTYRWGVGAAAGGVYGASSDGERAYFAVADQRTERPGGLHGVDLASGERVWFTPPADLLCAAGPGCGPAQSAAVTSIPGVVFSGSMDGGLRAYDSETGEIIWTFNANRRFDTVNGVEANGGSLDAAGPVLAGGMLFVPAGNGGPFGSPGNVLLAFSLE